MPRQAGQAVTQQSTPSKVIPRMAGCCARKHAPLPAYVPLQGVYRRYRGESGLRTMAVFRQRRDEGSREPPRVSPQAGRPEPILGVLQLGMGRRFGFARRDKPIGSRKRRWLNPRVSSLDSPDSQGSAIAACCSRTLRIVFPGLGVTLACPARSLGRSPAGPRARAGPSPLRLIRARACAPWKQGARKSAGLRLRFRGRACRPAPA